MYIPDRGITPSWRYDTSGITFLIFIKICCDPSLDQSWQNCSNEGSLNIFYCKLTEVKYYSLSPALKSPNIYGEQLCALVKGNNLLQVSQNHYLCALVKGNNLLQVLQNHYLCALVKGNNLLQVSQNYYLCALVKEDNLNDLSYSINPHV